MANERVMTHRIKTVVTGLLGALLVACAGSGAREGVAAVADAESVRGDGKLVLVAGATGGTGQAVVEKALVEGYIVRVLVRDVEKAKRLFTDRVDYVEGDVREARSLGSAVRGVRYVISAVGSSGARDPENSPELVDFAGVKALAEAAKQANVEQFVLTSSLGVTHPDHPLNQMFDNVLQWKLRGEDALRATGLNYTIVRPGGLTNDAGGQRRIKVMQGDAKDADGRISRADLAAVLVNALGRREAYRTTFEIVDDTDKAQSATLDWNRLYSGLKPDGA